MEYRNYYNTPRDMVGDEMLTELLREKEPHSDHFGGYATRTVSPRNEMGGGNTGGMNGGCGCTSCRESAVRGGTSRQSGTPNCRGEYPAVPVGNVEVHPHKWENPRLEGNPLAMVYSPAQEFEGLYEVDKALSRGTLFERLDLVFNHGCCSR